MPKLQVAPDLTMQSSGPRTDRYGEAPGRLRRALTCRDRLQADRWPDISPGVVAGAVQTAIWRRDWNTGGGVKKTMIG
jgi:hypothetical protein